MSFAMLGVANFLYIFLKAWQQRNVAYLHYGWALATNWFLVVTEVCVMGSIALAVVEGGPRDLLFTVLALGIGGGSGCLSSMYLHSKYIKEKRGA